MNINECMNRGGKGLILEKVVNNWSPWYELGVFLIFGMEVHLVLFGKYKEFEKWVIFKRS